MVPATQHHHEHNQGSDDERYHHRDLHTIGAYQLGHGQN
jgi:hypothetical protein